MISELEGRLKKIIMSETFMYFPHFSAEDLVNWQPYERLESMQGENSTYFIGSLFNFESTENTAEYAQYLINKHFA